MKSIKKELEPKSPLPPEQRLAEVRSSVSTNSPQNLSVAKSPDKNLSTNIAEHLLLLMKDVTKQEVSPSTVKAACECAQQMYNLMRLNIEMKKLGM